MAPASVARSRGFAPLCGAHARLLILGTLPGRASLTASEYYANRQNAFWRLMGELLAAGFELPYAARCARLTAAGIALWDVCHSAERQGSLDAAIRPTSVLANDIGGLLAGHPGIHTIALNGQTAARLFARHVEPRVAKLPRLIVLPSTSPAHATLRFEAKRRAWRAAFERAGIDMAAPHPG